MEDFRLPAPLVGMLKHTKLTDMLVVQTDLQATKRHYHLGLGHLSPEDVQETASQEALQDFCAFYNDQVADFLASKEDAPERRPHQLNSRRRRHHLSDRSQQLQVSLH